MQQTLKLWSSKTGKFISVMISTTFGIWVIDKARKKDRK